MCLVSSGTSFGSGYLSKNHVFIRPSLPASDFISKNPFRTFNAPFPISTRLPGSASSLRCPFMPSLSPISAVPGRSTCLFSLNRVISNKSSSLTLARFVPFTRGGGIFSLIYRNSFEFKWRYNNVCMTIGGYVGCSSSFGHDDRRANRRTIGRSFPSQRNSFDDIRP